MKFSFCLRCLVFMLFAVLSGFCFPCSTVAHPSGVRSSQPLRVGAARTEVYLPELIGKRVGVVANQTSVIPMVLDYRKEDTLVHLVDMLLDSSVQVVKVFSPEHGFRGQAEAGASVRSEVDSRTGLPVISLYGSHKKPTKEDLQGLDIVLFDLQDVGVRFYTYISTLHYVMEACAENNLPLVVLDRPNPHISYIDGPVLDTVCCRSFVGMHPVPVVYGMTIGEYARMINGEQWLKAGIRCQLKVVPLSGYTRDTYYEIPVPPSPNLRSMRAIHAYPSLCFFEGTVVSVGRGTLRPFECAGFPGCSWGTYTFTPRSIAGMSMKPPFEGKLCQGIEVDARFDSVPSCLDLEFLLGMYKVYPEKEKFFNAFFNKLAGNSQLKEQIREEMDEEAIRRSWLCGLEAFEHRRQPYLIYR